LRPGAAAPLGVDDAEGLVVLAVVALGRLEEAVDDAVKPDEEV